MRGMNRMPEIPYELSYEALESEPKTLRFKATKAFRDFKLVATTIFFREVAHRLKRLDSVRTNLRTRVRRGTGNNR